MKGEFIFFHIPKCGGSSVRSGIRDAAMRDGVASSLIRDEFSPHPNSEELIGKKVVASHFRYGVHLSAGLDGAFTFVMLRNPVDRLISSYYFLLNRVAAGVDGFERSYLTSFLSREHIEKIDSIDEAWHIDDCPEDIFNNFIERSKDEMFWYFGVDWTSDVEAMLRKRIDEIDLIGFIEDMPRTERLLNERGPFNSKITLGRLNVGRKRREPSQRVIRAVKKVTKMDQKAYDYAFERFIR